MFVTFGVESLGSPGLRQSLPSVAGIRSLAPYEAIEAGNPGGCVPLQNINSQHPPHEEQSDHGHDDIANPLADGPWLGAVGHEAMVAGSLHS
jgi:hypothetical protein